MPGPYDPKNARVRFSSTQAGTYTNGALFTSYSHDAGTENATTSRYFGGESRRAGDPTDSGTLNAFFENPDTTGQDLLRTARDTGGTVWMQRCPVGTATGAKVYQMQITVDSYNESADVNSDNVTVTFSYTAVQGTITTVTLA
jgi:hypothetical protein